MTFRQVFDGVPVITPPREPSTDVAPPEPGSGRPAAAPRERDPREALDAAQRTLLAHLAAVTADEPERQGAASARDLRVQDVPGTFGRL
ncbi:hypothetical protein [Streptomyces sp. NPDC018584]|uniref:hypothetical protein n=1 Tax=unclassified Streptomyces TaxID=2593676 RepID=UPI0037B6D751